MAAAQSPQAEGHSSLGSARPPAAVSPLQGLACPQSRSRLLLHHHYFKPECNLRTFPLAAGPEGGLSLWLEGDQICIYNLSSIERASEIMNWKCFHQHQKILKRIPNQHFANMCVYKELSCAGFTVLISLVSFRPHPSPNGVTTGLTSSRATEDMAGRTAELGSHQGTSRPSRLAWGGEEGMLPGKECSWTAFKLPVPSGGDGGGGGCSAHLGRWGPEWRRKFQCHPLIVSWRPGTQASTHGREKVLWLGCRRWSQT